MRIPQVMANAGAIELFKQNDLFDNPLKTIIDGKIHRLGLKFQHSTGDLTFTVSSTEELTGKEIIRANFHLNAAGVQTVFQLLARAICHSPEPDHEEYKAKFELTHFVGDQREFQDAGAAVLQHVADIWVGYKKNQIWLAFLDKEGKLPKIRFMMDNLEN